VGVQRIFPPVAGCCRARRTADPAQVAALTFPIAFMPNLPVLDPAYTAHVGAAPFIGLSALLRRAFGGGDVTELGPALIERATQQGDLYALLELSNVLQLHFQREAGLAVQAEALKAQRLYRIAQAADARALRVLVLKSSGDLMSNTPFECLFDDYALSVDVLYVAPGVPWPAVLPEHDVLLVAVGESDANQVLLAELDALLAHWPRPVLNRPALIARLARDIACATLAPAAGVMMPAVARVARAALEQLAAGTVAPAALAGSDFPLIVRPVGSHAGSGLARIERAAELPAYLQEHGEEAFFIAPFIDYASPDGLFRKFRVVLIDGQAHVCHMGISQHWMVHYPYEEMIAHPERRAEEQALMAHFAQDFAQRHAGAFAALQQGIGLDYWGLDCAETRDGRLLIFEVASAMVIHAMDRTDLFPYKSTHMHTVFAAFHRLLERTARRGLAA
jgi:glutathione synthase/RimK-type ligase-like ATP-grasp enzyme